MRGLKRRLEQMSKWEMVQIGGYTVQRYSDRKHYLIWDEKGRNLESQSLQGAVKLLKEHLRSA